MKNIIKYDFYRLVKSRKLWLVYIVSVALCIYNSISACGGIEQDISVSFLELVAKNDSLALIIPVFVIFFVVDEFASGYMKNTWAIDPFLYMLSKGLCVLLFSVAYFALTWIVTAVVGTCTFKKFVLVTEEAVKSGWSKAQLLYCLFNFACGIEAGMIAVLASIIIKTYLPWIIVHFVYKLLAFTLVCDIIFWTTGIGNTVALLLPLTGGAKYFAFLVEHFADTVAVGKSMALNLVLAPFGVVFCWCIAVVVIGGVVLKRKKI